VRPSLLAAALLAAGCASPAPPPPAGPAGAGERSAGAETKGAPAPATLHPRGPGARVYAASTSALPASERPALAQDALRAGIVEDARASARRGRMPPLEADARLDMAMNDLAASLRGEELPALEVVDFLLAHYGLPEPAPHLLMSRSSAGPEAERVIRQHTAAEVADVMRTAAIARIGVGIDRQADATYVVIALQERHVELGPVPRQLPPGGKAEIAGRLESHYRDPEVVITAPNGRVSEQRLQLRAGAFRAGMLCGPDGRYQVEVNAADAGGTSVLANFPVFCGVAPPAAVAHPAGVKVGVVDEEAAERQMLALVNRDRAAAGLPPVRADKRLGAVARAHSREMADGDAVFHVSSRTGTALDRVHRAGLTPTLVLENVGRAYSVEEVESGFLASPGHRGNIVDPRAAFLGVGVVLGKPVTGATPLFVTQLYTN
jgi:uncharacterized protein YkwD